MGKQAEIGERYVNKWAELMMEKIKNLQSDWRKPWFTEGNLEWPKNLDGREYNGMNAVMLMLLCEKENYRLPVFCTFNRVAGLNYSVAKDGSRKPLMDNDGERLPAVTVNKGEKSFPIFLTLFKVVSRETGEEIKYEDYNKLPEEKKRDYNLYPKARVYNVFNVAQTNLEQVRPKLYAKLEEQCHPMRPASTGGEEFSFPAMDEIIGRGLWLCPIKPSYQDEAYYSISRDEIVLPEKSQFTSGETFYGTAFHEMTHSTGAEGRLDRIKPATFGSADYAREELVAELGAALVASRYGIVKHVKDDSAAYLKSWLDRLRESPEFIKTTLVDVRKAASLIIRRVDETVLEMERGARKEGKIYYSSVACLQSADDTSLLDGFRDKGDCEGLLQAAKGYYDGNGINEQYTYTSPIRNEGDDLLAEDGDFAVVYNGSAGGIYELMLKFTEREIRDHILRYGVDCACDTLKGIAKEMLCATV